jgi:DNA-binding PadR family transcriptional regulator
MVAAPLTLELALLGFLRGHPMYPYEIWQTLASQQELGRVWRLKQSHLYQILDRLEAEGYVATTTELQGTRPPRKITSLTPSGRAAFDHWVAAPVAHGRDFRLEFLAKLYFAAREGPATVAALVDKQRVACQGWLDDLRAQSDAIAPDRPYDRLVVGFRVRQITAILAWLDDCLAALVP